MTVKENGYIAMSHHSPTALPADGLLSQIELLKWANKLMFEIMDDVLAIRE